METIEASASFHLETGVIDVTDELILVSTADMIDLTSDVVEHTGLTAKRPLSFTDCAWDVDTDVNAGDARLSDCLEDICFYCVRCNDVIKETAVLRICGCVSHAILVEVHAI